MAIRCDIDRYREYLMDSAETDEESAQYENMSDGEIQDIYWSGYEDHCYEVEKDLRLIDDDY